MKRKYFKEFKKIERKYDLKSPLKPLELFKNVGWLKLLNRYGKLKTALIYFLWLLFFFALGFITSYYLTPTFWNYDRIIFSFQCAIVVGAFFMLKFYQLTKLYEEFKGRKK